MVDIMFFKFGDNARYELEFRKIYNGKLES